MPTAPDKKRIYSWRKCLSCGYIYAGYAARPKCSRCGSRLVQTMGADELKCMIRCIRGLEQRVEQLEKKFAEPDVPAKIIGEKKKKLVFVR